MPFFVAAAPMMDVSDRHFRYFLRLLSRHLILYTEMLTAKALRYGNAAALLAFSPEEQPLVLQIGGSEPDDMAHAAALGAAAGYREININVGCPSPRVQRGAFGACLMREPATVAACARAMQAASGLPVTVKTRLGVDEDDSYDFLKRFIADVAEAGVDHFIIHARKAYLHGLNPKQNRHIPPLDYERVQRLKCDFVHLKFSLNGGITSLAEVQTFRKCFDGVMIGRSLQNDPYPWSALDSAIFGDNSVPLARDAIAQAYLRYASAQSEIGVRWSALLKPLLMLYAGQPNGRLWRQRLATAVQHPYPLIILQESLAVAA